MGVASAEASCSLAFQASQLIFDFRHPRRQLLVRTQGGGFLDGDRRPAEGSLFELPADVDVIFRTAKEELVSESASRIRFFADGSSTGGRVTLARDGAAYHISVDWLTGRVAITE